ncbi:hypothetical protein BKA80DRAFT_269817 [Phyllosticta citrichinensis]
MFSGPFFLWDSRDSPDPLPSVTDIEADPSALDVGRGIAGTIVCVRLSGTVVVVLGMSFLLFNAPEQLSALGAGRGATRGTNGQIRSVFLCVRLSETGVVVLGMLFLLFSSPVWLLALDAGRGATRGTADRIRSVFLCVSLYGTAAPGADMWLLLFNAPE